MPYKKRTITKVAAMVSNFVIGVPSLPVTILDYCFLTKFFYKLACVNNISVEKRTAAPTHKTPVLSFCEKEKKNTSPALFFELPKK